MATNGEIEITWGDGDHKFNIARIRCVLELEDKCGAGVGEIFNRIRESRWKINDLRETIRLGLIGGGKPPEEALKLVQRYVDDRPWAESLLPAQAILIAAMVGATGDDTGKKAKAERVEEGRPITKTDDLSVPLSTDSEPPSDSTRVN